MVAGVVAERARAPPGSRDWSELPLDAITSVFAKLGAVDILMGAGLVCRSWLSAAEEPSLWRHLDMSHKVVEKKIRCRELGILRAMAKKALDRSSGRLEVFIVVDFVDDDFLKYIGGRAPSLKVLRLISCPSIHNEGFMEAINKLPLLEELRLVSCPCIGGRATYDTVGKACENLKHLVVFKDKSGEEDYFRGINCDEDEAYGIAAMHGLRSLKIFRSNLTNKALAAIVDNNPHLESVDLYDCFNIVMDDAICEPERGVLASKCTCCTSGALHLQWCCLRPLGIEPCVVRINRIIPAGMIFIMAVLIIILNLKKIVWNAT